MSTLRTVDPSPAHGAKHVLRDVAVEIPEGQLVLTVGAGASGRTTRLRGPVRIPGPEDGRPAARTPGWCPGRVRWSGGALPRRS